MSESERQTKSFLQGDSADMTLQRARHLQHNPILLPLASAFRESCGLDTTTSPRTAQAAYSTWVGERERENTFESQRERERVGGERNSEGVRE